MQEDEPTATERDPRVRTAIRYGEAYITFRREQFAICGHTGLYLNEVYVPPQERGKGIARKMLARVLQTADESGTALFLEPAESDGLRNHELAAWYERHGFRRVVHNIYRRTPIRRRSVLKTARRWIRRLRRW